MPINIRCPECDANFPVTEAGRASNVECPYCDHQFSTTQDQSAAAPKPASTLADKDSKRPQGAKSQPAPKKAAAKPVRRSHRDDDDDDDDDDRGKSRNASGGSPVLVLVVAGFGLLFVLGALAVTAYLILSSGGDNETVDSTSAASSSSSQPQQPPPRNANPLFQNDPPKRVNPPLRNPTPPRNTNPQLDDPPLGNLPPRKNPPRENPPRKNPPRENPPRSDPPPFRPDRPGAFTLKPEPGTPVKIEPTRFTDNRPMTVKLPGKVGNVQVGGNGRYLVMHFPAERLIGVFDVSQAKIVRHLKDVGEDALFAAGQNKMVVLTPSARTLNVYTLPDLTPDGGGTPPPGQILDLAMGSATNGPLFVATFGDISIYDLRTKERVEGSASFNPPGGVPIHPGVAVRAAANGKVFGAQWRNHNAGTYTERDGKWLGTPIQGGAAYLSADGETAFGPGAIAGADGKQIGQKLGGHGKGVWYVPAVHGDYFLRLDEQKQGDAFNRRQWLSATVHAARNPVKVVANIGNLPEADGLVDWFSGAPQPLDRLVFLVPDAQVLALIAPKSRDTIVLRKVKLK